MSKRYVLAILLIIFSLLLENCLTMRTSDSRAIRRFQKKGISLIPHMIHIDGHSIHYVSVGADTMRTIVFVHGSPGSWTAFKRYLMDAGLRSQFRLIGIDRPGFGYSEYGQAISLLQNCRVISAFLDSIYTGKPLLLVGHSLGGSIVPIVAAENPDRVSAIIILAGALDPAVEPREPWVYPFTRTPWRYLVPGAFRQGNDEEWLFKTDILRLKEKLPLIRCHVYILHATNDAIVDVRNVDYIKRTFTSAVVTDTIFPRGGHFIPWNHSDYIIRLLSHL
jgi:pimeloyl-ACP methyl ester carboxylesterase